ncbi:uncharacterized protein LOC123561608 [Mercenaria mercenaria]|uniref:uncharacterized protein LOC123561608 n=1 Tax=Mercenaria mercenaria TaxID=6596 RepID=UPI00234E7998|nr:uncharacterized protein LOC123561608 [Mercenaria mercenaria]
MASSLAVLALLSTCFTCLVFCANTHPRPIQGGMSFYYDPAKHHFIAATSSTCFMVSLTRIEQDHVHTTQGVEDLELMMMRQWLGKLNEVKVYHDDINLTENIKRWCATKDIYLLERNVTAAATPVSPLASIGP